MEDYRKLKGEMMSAVPAHLRAAMEHLSLEGCVSVLLKRMNTLRTEKEVAESRADAHELDMELVEAAEELRGNLRRFLAE